MCDRGVFAAPENKFNFRFVNPSILAHAPHDVPRELPDGFQPGFKDIICSRGADCYNHVGNQAFRRKLEEHLEEYSRALNKLEKSLAVSSIIDEVREDGGAFVRQDPHTGKWCEVGDRLAREKAGQAIRSILRKPCASAGKTRSCMRRSDRFFREEGCKSKAQQRDDMREECCSLQNEGTASWKGSQTGNDVTGETPEAALKLQTANVQLSDTEPLDEDMDSHERIARDDFSRDTSVWSSLERIPGLFDCDPFTLPSADVRRMSSSFSVQGVSLDFDISE